MYTCTYCTCTCIHVRVQYINKSKFKVLSTNKRPVGELQSLGKSVVFVPQKCLFCWNGAIKVFSSTSCRLEDLGAIFHQVLQSGKFQELGWEGGTGEEGWGEREGGEEGRKEKRRTEEGISHMNYHALIVHVHHVRALYKCACCVSKEIITHL